LHSPKYDFNDDILPTTIEYMAEIVETKLKT
jgi:metal-dependent amidase/aminoacylase/carboxypeptidase family protein